MKELPRSVAIELLQNYEEVAEILKLLCEGKRQCVVARQFGVGRSAIDKIASGKT